MKFRVQALLLPFTILFLQASAQISLPKVFGDSMVLQRGIRIPVWGASKPGALIIGKLGNVKATAKADPQGKWQIKFPAFRAGGPYVLEIVESGKPESKIQLKGILIGDVWLASGQSNMEWQVQQSNDAAKEIANATFPEIRLLLVQQNKQLKPQSDISDFTYWQSANDYRLAANWFYNSSLDDPHYSGSYMNDNNSDIAFGTEINTISSGKFVAPEHPDSRCLDRRGTRLAGDGHSRFVWRATR